MVDLCARRLSFPTRAIGMTDVLSPFQVRAFADCEVRWFYEHLLGLTDPVTATKALDNAIRTALMTNFRHKLESKTDIQTEGVVGLFGRAWKRQQASVIFCEDEVPQAMGRTGEALVRVYMQQVAPNIRPAAVEQPLHGVIGGVRIHAQLDVMDVDGTIIDIRTTPTAPAPKVDPMHRFELATCSRLAEGASGVIRSDILVASSTPQLVSCIWEVTAADVQWTDALYPLAQHAMQRGYYMPQRNSNGCSRHHCPHGRCCEQDFGGVVEA